MPRLKCTYREFIAIIEKYKFVCGRQHGGSHRQYTRVVGQRIYRVTISYHNINDEIKPRTLESMIRQSGLDKSLFRK